MGGPSSRGGERLWWGRRGPASLISLLASLGTERPWPQLEHPCARRLPTMVGTQDSCPHAVPSLCRGDAISYARIHQQQKQMDEEKLTGALEGQAL